MSIPVKKNVQKKKLIRCTTVAITLNVLLKGQLAFLNDYFEVIAMASGEDVLRQVSKREGCRTMHVPMKREICLRSDVVALWKLIKIFYKEKPFIVHVNTPKASLLAMVAAWITRVPHRIYTVTGLRFETSEGKMRWLLKMMEIITCFCATKVIPEGEGVKNTLIKNKITRKPLNKILNGNINGIDLVYYSRTEEVLAQANQIELKCNGFIFCFIGRMVKDKGINELVEAFLMLYRQNDAVRLLLVGSFETELDPLLPETEYVIRHHEAIFFMDYQKDVRPFLAASDVFVFPSYREGFPNVVLQAGAMGLPSIVTNISGSNEIIKEGENGSIIPSKDVKALYEMMYAYRKMPSNYLSEMGKKAREEVEAHFGQREVWEAILKMYRHLK